MKYLISFIFSLLVLSTVWAQPANDDCFGIIDLGTLPSCDQTVYSNINATPTNIGNLNKPNCFKTEPSNDVWFKFTASSEDIDFSIQLFGITDGPNAKSIQNSQLAIYRGSCAQNSLFLNSCVAVQEIGQSALNLDLPNLTAGETYYVRVDNYGGNQYEGDFSLCIKKKPTNIISDGSSSSCNGILFDTGGADGNYEDDEEHAFTICPQEENKCIELYIEYFNIGDDALSFYNGPNTNAPLIKEFTEGGGVGHTIMADSCLTVYFTSNSSANYEGFAATWQCSPVVCKKDEILNIKTDVTDSDIVDAISTPLSQVVIDTIICNKGAYALFNDGDKSDLGLSKGLLLTTGKPTNALGPNLPESNVGHSWNSAGDQDLDSLSTTNNPGDFKTFDACVIEVDVTVYTPELKFEYIFGSEEYPEYVNQNFNDVFGLFISGPEITGEPKLNNQQNMAILPNSNTPITINNVNNLTNWQYYRNNKDGQSLGYDGLTSGFLGNPKSLTASAVVQPCSTYHLKFAIADRADYVYDSGVFIAEITSGIPKVSTKFASGLDYFVEKCNETTIDSILIQLDEPLAEDTEFRVVIGGNASQPDDYKFDIGDVVIFKSGETQKYFTIEVFDDEIEEGEETISITLVRNFGCGDVEMARLDIPILENADVEIVTPGDTLLVCGSIDVQLEATGATDYVWYPLEAFVNPFIKDPILKSGYNGWVSVTGTIAPFTIQNCSATDSIFIFSVEPSIDLQPDELKMCLGDSVLITQTNNVDNAGLLWSQFGNNEFENPNATEQWYKPAWASDKMVIAQVSIGSCIATDTLSFIVDPIQVPTPLFSDTTVCETTELAFNENVFWTQDTKYKFTPNTGIVDDTLVNTTFIATTDTEYTLFIESASGYCKDTLTYNVTVLPNLLDIIGEDSIRICKGDSVLLQVNFSPQNAVLTWTPDNSLNIMNNNNVKAGPSRTTIYTLNSSSANCSNQAKVKVFVDSIPNMDISVIPQREFYCKGEPITLTSDAYEKFYFPNMKHSWNPSTGAQNDPTDYNLVVSTEETTLYVRESVNGACTQLDSIEIKVIDPKVVLTPNDTTICAGSSIEVEAKAEQELKDISWTSQSGNFACNDCPKTTLSNIVTNSVVNFEGKIEDCPVSASLNVTTIGYGGNITTEPDSACNFYGDNILLNANIFPTPPEGSTIVWLLENSVIEGATSNPYAISLPGDDGKTKGEKRLKYSWTITDPMGCTGSGGTDICVKNRFDVPDVFSPNNDEVNDVFRVVDFGKDRPAVEVIDFGVYNRYGQRVFDCQDFDCATKTGWDGTYKDIPQHGGTYMYVISLKYADGTVLKYKGDVLLLR